MKNRNMPSLRPSQDVRPVTEFRANASAFLEQIRVTKRVVILTQHGRSAAVLLDVGVYEALLGELALLRNARGSGPRHETVPNAPTPESAAREPEDAVDRIATWLLGQSGLPAC